MKAKVRIEGNDGHGHYKPGDELDRDGEHLRQLIVAGLAEPLDDAARALAASEDARERYGRPELAAIARELADAPAPPGDAA